LVIINDEHDVRPCVYGVRDRKAVLLVEAVRE